MSRADATGRRSIVANVHFAVHECVNLVCLRCLLELVFRLKPLDSLRYSMHRPITCEGRKDSD